MTGALVGRTAIVTGASRGLGFAVADAYLNEGASVFLCARDKDTLECAQVELESRHGEARVAAVAADVSRLDDVGRVVTGAIEEFTRVDILVNNAGIQGPIGRLEEVDWDEWEYTVRVNLLGSVLCCREILPHLRANGYGKIVQLSGGGATSSRPHFSAYAASKTAVVRFIETLADEVGDCRIDVNAIAPGVLNTRLLDQIVGAGPARLGESVYRRTLEHREEGGTPMALAARLAVYLGSAASDGISGKLISALWDPWDALAERRAELAESDIYTLRRIVPADRGLDWGEPNGKQGQGP